MSRRSIRSLTFLFVLVSLLAATFSLSAQETSRRGRKFKMPPPTAKVDVLVVRDSSGKPVENAAVVFHVVGEKDNMELKTNDEGKASIDVLPLKGNIRLQIIAKGFQTYGADFKLDKETYAIEVRLKRPGEQYSIYKPHETQAGSEKKPEPGAEQKKNDAPQPK